MVNPILWLKLKSVNSLINSLSEEKMASLMVDLSKKQFKEGYVENIKTVRAFLALLNFQLGKLI